MPEYREPPKEGEVKLLATMHWSAVVMTNGRAPKAQEVKNHYSGLLSRVGEALGPENARVFDRQYDAALTGVASREGSEWG